MKKVSIDDAVRLRLAVACLVLLVGACVYLWLSGLLGPVLTELFAIFENRDTLRLYVENWDNAAPIVFIFIQALQVVIAPIPGELTGAVGGFIFGALPNNIYSTIGSSIGSMGAFLAARVIGMPLVKYFVSGKSLERFHFLT